MLFNVFFFGVCALLFGAFAFWWSFSSPEKLPEREKIPRVRWVGIVFGIPALLWCIPHAAAVSPDGFAPFFLPLAVLVPVAGFFVLDFILARTLAGWAIILGYEIVHRSFEIAIPGSSFFAVSGWILGIGGIWISGIPCHFRDAIRLACRNKIFRFAVAGFFGVFALLSLYGAVLSRLHV